MELNAEQIKKALECCKTPLASDCENCSYTGKRLEDGVYEGCVNCLVGDALALITSQEQRIGAQDMTISELRKRAEKAEHDADRYAQRIKELTEENERLSASLTSTTEAYEFVNGIVLKSRADTVRKMQERLKAEKFTHKNFGELVYVEDIDQIAKEMVGEG